MLNKLYKKLFDINNFLSPVMAVLVANLCLSLGFGLLAAVLGIRLENAGVSTSVSGWVMSFYFIGMGVASITAYKIILRAGHIRAFAVFATLISSATLVHGFWVDPIFWGFLRLVEGYCVAGLLICLESWLNAKSTNRTRGLTMSLYMLSSYLGVAAGQVAINIPDDSGFNIYVLTSIFFSVSLIPLALTRIMSPEIATTESISLKKLYKKAPVGVVGCLASGLLTSVFYTITPIYASISNMDIKQTSFFMATCTIGGMFFQMPMGKFSDTRDRRLIILFSSIMLILFAIVMMFSNSIPMIVAYGIMFLYGGMMFTYYPLSVSHINDVLTEDERVTATGGMALSYGIGAVTGPVIATFFMSTLGAWAFFLYSTIVVGSFTGVTVLELKKKPKMDYEEQTPTEPIHAARVSNVVEVSEEFQGL